MESSYFASILIVASLALASVISSKLSFKFGVPALLLFLVIGMLAGSDGPGGLYFDNYALSRDIGVLALAYILYAGGLETRWERIRASLGPGLLLALPATLLTAALLGLAAWAFAGFSPSAAFLLGAIVCSTDAAAVFNALRGKGGLKGNLRETLEFESSSNDPVAVALTLVAIGVATGGEFDWTQALWRTPLEMLIGAGLGYGLGRGAAWAINRLHLEYDGLYIVVYVALAPAIFALVSLAYGNGFLAVYVAGATLGNAKIVHQRSAVRFMDGAVWLLNIGCFLMLGLLVFPLQLVQIALPGTLLALCMIFVARPLAVFLSLAPTKLDWRARLFIAWAGLRGAAPIILATFPMAAGVVGAERIFNIVFFVVLLSLLIQGTTLPHVARWLGLETTLPRRSLYPFEYENREGSDSRLEEFLIPYGAAVVGRSVIEAGLPDDALIVLIARGESYIAPSGRTVLASGDVLLALVNDQNFSAVRRQLTAAAVSASAAERDDAG